MALIPLRDENPSGTTPWVTFALIACCVLVFGWQWSLGQDANQAAVLALGVTPAVLFGLAQLPPALDLVPPSLTMFTSMFMHGGLMHLLGNLLFLWIFADNIEDNMGRVRFLLFYLLCGIAAALAQAGPEPASTVPMIGASGAISGVLGAYAVLYPKARVLVVVPVLLILAPMRLRAALVLGAWFVMQLLSSIGASPDEAGVAFRAHIGGFVAGMLLVYVFRRSPQSASARSWERER